MECIVLLGAPGAGKGTAAQYIVDQGGYEHLSTGDLLREEIRSDTELGREADRFMSRGELVPDAVVLDLIQDRTRACGRYVLDGMPRTVAQARMLDALLTRRNGTLVAAILLSMEIEPLVRRLAGRRVCPGCGAIYHVENRKPRVAGRCDRCGDELIRREDDREDTIRRRIMVYEAALRDLLDYYRADGVLRVVDAQGSPEAVHARLQNWLDAQEKHCS